MPYNPEKKKNEAMSLNGNWLAVLKDQVWVSYFIICSVTLVNLTVVS